MLEVGSEILDEEGLPKCAPECFVIYLITTKLLKLTPCRLELYVL